MLLPPCDLLIGAMKGLEWPLASCSPNIHKSWLMQSANNFYAICKYSRLFSLAIIGIAGISRIAHCCQLAALQWWQVIGAITIAVKGLQSADPWFLLLTMMMKMMMTKIVAYSKLLNCDRTWDVKIANRLRQKMIIWRLIGSIGEKRLFNCKKLSAFPTIERTRKCRFPLKEKYVPPANTCPIKWKSMKGVQDRRIGVKCTLMGKVIHPPTRGNFVVNTLWKSAVYIVFNAFLLRTQFIWYHCFRFIFCYSYATSNL